MGLFRQSCILPGSARGCLWIPISASIVIRGETAGPLDGACRRGAKDPQKSRIFIDLAKAQILSFFAVFHNPPAALETLENSPFLHPTEPRQRTTHSVHQLLALTQEISGRIIAIDD